MGSGAQEPRDRRLRGDMIVPQAPPRRSRRHSRRTLHTVFVTASSVFSVLSVVALVASAQAPDWSSVAAEATRLLQEYVRLDTSNPPGDTRRAADFLTAILERDGVRVTRYESAPGKALVLARLRATIA